MTITIGNTIFGALDGERPVDWGLEVWDLIQRLVVGVGKLKPTSMCSFFSTSMTTTGYRITLEQESRAGSKDEEQDNTPAASPIREEPGVPKGEEQP